MPASSTVWSEALERVPSDVFHCPEYVAIDAERLGGVPAAFVFRDRGRSLLVPLVLRAVTGTTTFDAVSPYGYGGPTSDTQDQAFWQEGLAAFRTTLNELGIVCCLLRLHPLMAEVDQHLEGLADVVEHGETVSIDLTQDTDAIARRIRNNHQRDIARARQRGLEPVVDDWEQLPAFNTMYAETMDRVGATDDYRFPADYLPSLRTALGDAVHLVTVLSGPTAIAAGVFFEAAGMVGYHLGATRTAALADRPSKLMMDAAWRWAQQRGNRVLHLGGGLGGTSNGSLFHFKAGFSSQRHRFVTARLVLDAPSYQELAAPVLGQGREPGGRIYFPAYRDASAVASRTAPARHREDEREVEPWPATVP